MLSGLMSLRNLQISGEVDATGLRRSVLMDAGRVAAACNNGANSVDLDHLPLRPYHGELLLCRPVTEGDNPGGIVGYQCLTQPMSDGEATLRIRAWRLRNSHCCLRVVGGEDRPVSSPAPRHAL
jgi:hypothetical protein